ncbi:unnamed protein product [Chilo suppressalis]|uniref:FHOD1 N-terminal GTPase-binding domain-containing protein n=1 Tax=Chilo suppressalis TaxID=168631 RepID=A0ABN8AZF2_CHISP|nr:unnamed protein product [Chilo suppressalis]
MIELVKVSDNQKVVGTMRDIGADSFVCRVQYLNDLDPFSEYNVREPSRPLYHTFNTTIPLSYQIAAVHRLLQAPHRFPRLTMLAGSQLRPRWMHSGRHQSFALDALDDATLQVFKDGDYGPYLDLDSTLGEQDEELEGLQDKVAERMKRYSQDSFFTRSSSVESVSRDVARTNRLSLDSGIDEDGILVKTSVVLDLENDMSEDEELDSFDFE